MQTSCEEFAVLAGVQVAAQFREYTGYLTANADALPLGDIRAGIQARMSACNGFVRSLVWAEDGLREARTLYRRILEHGIRCADRHQLVRATEDRHLALTSIACLEALCFYIRNGGGSRGVGRLDGWGDWDEQGGKQNRRQDGLLAAHDGLLDGWFSCIWPAHRRPWHPW